MKLSIKLSLSDLLHAPLYNDRYQGYSYLKELTKNCGECKWYVKIDENDERCYGQKYWKRIIGPHAQCELNGYKLRKCGQFGRLHPIEEMMTKFLEDIRPRIEARELNLSRKNVEYRNRLYEWSDWESRWELRRELRQKYAALIPMGEDDPLVQLFGADISRDFRR